MSAAANEKSTAVASVRALPRDGGGRVVQFVTQYTDKASPFIYCEWSPSTPTALNLRRKVDRMRYESVLEQFVMTIADRMNACSGTAS